MTYRHLVVFTGVSINGDLKQEQDQIKSDFDRLSAKEINNFIKSKDEYSSLVINFIYCMRNEE